MAFLQKAVEEGHDIVVLDIPLLPYAVVSRGAGGLPSEEALRRLLDGIGLPCIVKPVHLGSSIGVGKAETIEEVRALLQTIFRLDNQALEYQPSITFRSLKSLPIHWQ